MPEEKTSKKLTALLVMLSILLLLIIDIYTMFLQPQAKAISHLALAILTTQLFCNAVLLKSKIYPTLGKEFNSINTCLGIFWLIWFVLSLFSNYHYVLTDMISVCGMMMVLALWKLPEEITLRNSLLAMGIFSGILGVICYLWILIEVPMLFWLQYNLFIQISIAIVLVYLISIVSLNPSQSIIITFLLLIVALFLNAMIVSIIVNINLVADAVFFSHFASIVYFVLHFLMIIVLLIHIVWKIKFHYLTVGGGLIMLATLPLWATLAYIK